MAKDNQPYVFNIGLNRCGTTSLAKALNILEIPTIHYRIDNEAWDGNDEYEIETLIQKNKSKKLNLFHGIDKIYKGFIDFNGQRYFDTLYKQYPNSKFIFTYRPAEEWIRSVIKMEKHQYPHLFNKDTLEYNRMLEMLSRYFNSKIMIEKFFQDKPNNFLKMNILDGDGWKVLCTFLEKDIPQDIPFPHLNKEGNAI